MLDFASMRRFLVFLMLFLLPFQISWAVAANYCEHGHEQDKETVSYFGHHDDEHKASSSIPDDSTQSGEYDFGHAHCHLSAFLGVLSAHTFSMCGSLQSSLHYSDCSYPSLAPDKPERPKWSVPA